MRPPKFLQHQLSQVFRHRALLQHRKRPEVPPLARWNVHASHLLVGREASAAGSRFDLPVPAPLALTHPVTSEPCRSIGAGGSWSLQRERGDRVVPVPAGAFRSRHGHRPVGT